MTAHPSIAFVGMGEAGSAFVTGWGEDRPGPIRAYDIKTDDPATAGPLWALYDALGITGCATLAEALDGADLVFCTVTADQANTAARAGAGHIPRGAVWLDLNSCAPSSKRDSAQAIQGAGGRYVDIAVMAPVHPPLNMVPCLASGPHAAAVAPMLEALPMKLRVVSDVVGHASSIKMVRSIAVKGLEALSAEFILAAVAAGVADDVLPSLREGATAIDMGKRASYNLERMMVHGARRAAEMDEVARMLGDLGLPNDMARATADWQRRIAALGVSDVPDEDADFTAFTDLLLPSIRG